MLIVRSIPLSQETQDAWRSQGAVFLRRDRRGRVPADLAEQQDLILNLGNTFLSCERPYFNDVNTIIAISHPNNLRRTFAETDILPERVTQGPHWHKSGGFRGQGKMFCEEFVGECAVIPGDVQRHVAGTEFRVITVGDVVVQAHRKIPAGGIGEFTWEWVGVRGVRNNGIIPLVKRAAESIPFVERSVLGWDMIVGDRPFVIEINTSPGVNSATAERIVRAMRGVQ